MLNDIDQILKEIQDQCNIDQILKEIQDQCNLDQILDELLEENPVSFPNDLGYGGNPA